jgi:DNA ligase (NAD+)
LIRKDGDAIHYCPNEDGCKPQLIGKIEHFIGRKAMNIDGLGDKRIDGLFKIGFIKSYADIYDLKLCKEKLIGLTFYLEEENENEFRDSENTFLISLFRLFFVKKIIKKQTDLKNINSTDDLLAYLDNANSKDREKANLYLHILNPYIKDGKYISVSKAISIIISDGIMYYKQIDKILESKKYILEIFNLN